MEKKSESLTCEYCTWNGHLCKSPPSSGLMVSGWLSLEGAVGTPGRGANTPSLPDSLRKSSLESAEVLSYWKNSSSYIACVFYYELPLLFPSSVGK